jgi:hypothetical protein
MMSARIPRAFPGASRALAILALFLCLPGAARAVTGTPRADAHRLLHLAEISLDGAEHAVRASARFDTAAPAQRAFLNALARMDGALRGVRTAMPSRLAMTGQEESFYQALTDGSIALGELRVTWARAGLGDPEVTNGLHLLSGCWRLLRTGYGREAGRFRQGGGLTAVEKQRFERIQEEQRRFAVRLRDLEDRARRRGDEAMLAEMRRMADDAARIATARRSLEAYLNALMLVDTQRGEWTANTRYADAADGEPWAEADAVLEDLWVDEDVGHVFTVDLGPAAKTPPAESAAPLEEPVDLPPDLAELAGRTAPVEVYRPVDAEAGADVDAEEDALAPEDLADEAAALSQEELETGMEEEAPLATEEPEEAPLEIASEPPAAAPESSEPLSVAEPAECTGAPDSCPPAPDLLATTPLASADGKAKPETAETEPAPASPATPIEIEDLPLEGSTEGSATAAKPPAKAGDPPPPAEAPPPPPPQLSPSTPSARRLG